MRQSFPILCFAVLATHFAAVAQESPEPKSFTATFEAVQVNGIGDPAWHSYKRLRLGVKAFQQNQALAPSAPLLFLLRPEKGGLAPDGLKLTLEAEGKVASISLDDRGRFVLPEPSADISDDAELVLNRSKNLYKWRPDIRTPNLPDNMRRLGDLRLECAVRWAVEYDDIPFLERNAYRALGGPCNARMVRVQYRSSSPIVEVKLTHATRQETLAKAFVGQGGTSYSVPLHDASWPDDTLVELIPAQPPG